MLENTMMTGYFFGFIGFALFVLTIAVYRTIRSYFKLIEEVSEEAEKDPYTGPQF